VGKGGQTRGRQLRTLRKMVGRVKKEVVAHLLYHAMGHVIGRPKTKMPATTKETAWCYGATKMANTIGDKIRPMKRDGYVVWLCM
jgi:hypothetical protein